MTQHPWTGARLLRIEDSEFGFPRPGGPDLGTLRAASAATATGVGGAHTRFVAAFLVHCMSITPDRAHESKVGREDEPLADARALRARRRVVALVDGEKRAEVAALGAGEVVNGHGAGFL